MSSWTRYMIIISARKVQKHFRKSKKSLLSIIIPESGIPYPRTKRLWRFMEFLYGKSNTLWFTKLINLLVYFIHKKRRFCYLQSYNERENEFYQTIPHTLRFIVPKYGGTLERENGKFLVLENLTKDSLKPCILDLKMGTRMYSDFASETKAKSQRRKCSLTTSCSLGVREGFI